MQGYHDVALTLLLIVGKRTSLAMMKELSASHFSVFMEPTMKSTAHLLNYLYPILQKENPELFRFILRWVVLKESSFALDNEKTADIPLFSANF